MIYNAEILNKFEIFGRVSKTKILNGVPTPCYIYTVDDRTPRKPGFRSTSYEAVTVRTPGLPGGIY